MPARSPGCSSWTLADQPLDPLTQILLAAVDEAALYIANSPNSSQAKDQAVATVKRLLSSLTT